MHSYEPASKQLFSMHSESLLLLDKYNTCQHDY